MNHMRVKLDAHGFLQEDWDQFDCDFCGTVGDIEDSYATDDREYMCEACYGILKDAEDQRVRDEFANGHMFVITAFSLDDLLELHGHLLHPLTGQRE